MNQKEILENVDRVIENGTYKDNWESLVKHPVPQWYRKAKFGVFIHWGVYSVPAFGNEWYPRNMYIQGTPEYEHHLKTYGNHKDFGYKDFIPMFKAEQFDAEKWMDLFERAGAKYVMPVAEHHDGFQMYGSDLSKWNAAEMGPKRDILGELKAEADKKGITFCASSHRAEHCWFFNAGTFYDSDVNDPEYEDFYEKQQFCDLERTQDITVLPPSKEHCENWLARTCELVDKYRPKLIFFDWWIQNLGWKPYLKKFAAYYFNRAEEWGEEVTINYKFDAFMLRSAVFDIERGQLDGINPMLWQNDTSIAKNSWGYTDNNEFKNPWDLAADLVDIVSKNGCLLLNVGPRPDGTITEEETFVLEEIGKWLKENGEGIYETDYWKVFGEGPTEIPKGSFTDIDRAPFTSEDIRFTCKGPKVYAYVLSYPEDGRITIKSLARELKWGSDCHVLSVETMDGEACAFTRDEEGLHIQGRTGLNTKYPVGFQILTE